MVPESGVPESGVPESGVPESGWDGELELQATSTAAAHTAIQALVCRDTSTRASPPRVPAARAGPRTQMGCGTRSPTQETGAFMTCESTPRKREVRVAGTKNLGCRAAA